MLLNSFFNYKNNQFFKNLFYIDMLLKLFILKYLKVFFFISIMFYYEKLYVNKILYPKMFKKIFNFNLFNFKYLNIFFFIVLNVTLIFVLFNI